MEGRMFYAAEKMGVCQLYSMSYRNLIVWAENGYVINIDNLLKTMKAITQFILKCYICVKAYVITHWI